MPNSPSNSNFAGLDDAAGTYTPPNGALNMSSPSYHSLDNPWPAEHDERYTKMDFKTPGFKPKLQHLDQSQ